MNISDVKKIIDENNIRKELIKINDNYLIPGVYYLYYDENLYEWRAFHYDREPPVTEQYFVTEDEACRKYLKLIFSEPTAFEDFSMNRLEDFIAHGKYLIEKYQL